MAPDSGRTKETFDAFASHATDPDGDLVRQVKAALEGFHKRPGVQLRFREVTSEPKLDPLHICVDGLDFVFPSAEPNEQKAIDDLIKEYLGQSDCLIIFSGTETLTHPWINKEIEWFRELHTSPKIYFVLTHGPNPDAVSAFMPPALCEGNFEPLFFDLRAHYRKSSLLSRLSDSIRNFISRTNRQSERHRSIHASINEWRSVRGFEEELGRIAARLISDRSGHALSVESLERSFELARRKSERQRWLQVGVLVGLLIAAITGLFLTIENLSEEQRLRTNRVWLQQADLMRQDVSATLIESLAYSVNAIANENVDDGPRSLIQTLQRLVPTELLYKGTSDTSAYDAGNRRSQVEAIMVLDEGERILFGGFDSHVILFDTRNRIVLQELDLVAGRIQAIKPLAGKYSVGIATQKGLHIVAVRKPKSPSESWGLVRTARVLENERLFDLAYDSETNRVITGTLEGELIAFDYSKGRLEESGHTIFRLLDPDVLDEDSGKPYLSASIYGMELRQRPSGGQRLFISSLSHLIAALDLEQGAASIAWIYRHDDSFFAMDTSRDGTIVIATDSNGKIIVLDGKTGAFKTQVRSYKIDPASNAEGPDGNAGFARPDTLSNVGLDLHPSGRFFAVSSHDRTTKIFETEQGQPMAAFVHNSMVRNVTFDPRGRVAYSYSDDGVIQRAEPFKPYETLRLGRIDRHYRLADGKSLVLVDQDESVYLWSRGDERPSRVAGLPASHARFTDVPGPDDLFALYDTTQQEFHAFRIFPVETMAEHHCAGTSLDAIIGLRNDESIEKISRGSANGEVIAVVRENETDNRVLRRIDVRNCRPSPSQDLPGGMKEIAFSVSPSTIAIKTAANGISIWRTDNVSTPPNTIGFTKELVSFAVGKDGKSALALLKADTADDMPKLCFCEGRNWGSRLSEWAGMRKSCGGADTLLACHVVETMVAWSGVSPRNVQASPIGEFFVVTGRNAEMAILGRPATFLSQATLIPLSGVQNRVIAPPYAFDPAEKRIAVPAGDTGFAVFDTAAWRLRTTLPTPGRVYRLGFLGDLAISIDGANENSILRVQPWQPTDLIRRACAFWPKATAPRVRSGVPSPQPRKTFCGD